jgi:periplasmic protein CpxP/Spy
MKYTIIFSMLLLSFVWTATVNAQNKDKQKNPSSEKKQALTPEQRAQKQTDKLQSKLGLTEEQKLKVYDLNLNRIKQNQALREKNKGNSEQKGSKEEFQKIRTDFDTQLNAILTADQQTKWAQLKEEHKDKRSALKESKGKGKSKKQEDSKETGSEEELEDNE